MLRCSWLPSPSPAAPATSTSTRLFGVMKPLTPVTSSTLTDIARMPSGIIVGRRPPFPVSSCDWVSGWFLSMVTRATESIDGLGIGDRAFRRDVLAASGTTFTTLARCASRAGWSRLATTTSTVLFGA